MNGADHRALVGAGPDGQPIELRMSDRERALVAAAMKRIETIMAAPEASGPNAKLAHFLAFSTQESVGTALAILKVASAGAAKPTGEHPLQRFLQGGRS
jgi:hypothetical protein